MRVYLSSTYVDLVDYRLAAVNAIRQAGFECSSMEDYSASDERPVAVCLDDLARCDVYVGLFAHRYGFVPDGNELSVTEQEYRRAVDRQIPTLVFLVEEELAWKKKWIDQDSTAEGQKLKRLKAELRQVKTVRSFSTPADLAASILAALHRRFPPTPPKFDEFRHQPGVDAALKMLDDYAQREIDFGAFGRREVAATTVAVALAETDADDDPDEPLYTAIRDGFDAFFDGLEAFEIQYRNDTINSSDVENLRYWMGKFADPASTKGPEFVSAARSYVQTYYPGEVQQLLARFGWGFGPQV